MTCALIALSPLISRADEESSSWLAAYEHLHASENGTPMVHAFNVEPAFTGRDLVTTYRYRSSDAATEREVELELEWAFTRRLGMIVEVPYVTEQERGGARPDGFGNLAVVPRTLLLESDRFMLTAQAEIGFPTATHDLEAGTSIAPGVAMWHDLGGWWTVGSQFAIEHAFDEDETEGIYGVALVKSFGNKHMGDVDHAGHHHHAPPSSFNVHLELTGSVGLKGDENGDVYTEGLVGFSYGFCSGVDLRVGYEFPITSPESFDYGWVAGCVWHF